MDLGYRSLTMAEFYSIYRQDSFQNCPLMTANVTFLLHFFFILLCNSLYETIWPRYIYIYIYIYIVQCFQNQDKHLHTPRKGCHDLRGPCTRPSSAFLLLVLCTVLLYFLLFYFLLFKLPASTLNWSLTDII